MDTAKNEKQLFVRNLSYQTTGEDLAALFQEFGPLKHTSVVQENGVSKGFGFVKFALEADTATALEKLQGHQLHGRRIKLELGVKKDKHTKKEDDSTTVDKQVIVTEATETSTTQKSEKKEKKNAEKKDKVESDGADVADGEVVEGGEENAAAVKKSRQILVMGVPVDVNKKAFKSALAKISRKADVELIKEENELSASLYIINPPGKIMLVTGSSRQEAAKLLAALNNATVHNLELRKFLPVDKTATPEEAAALVAKGRKEKLVARTLADMTEIEFRKRKCRVILRNLSFQSTEQNVVDKMSKFGPLVSVEIPRTVIEKSNSNRRKGKEDKAEGEEVLGDNQVLRPKGFGFVTFLCEKDAKAAVEGSAGLRVCNREVAIDFCMNKESYEKYGKTTDDGAAEAENEEGETDAAEESGKEADEERDDDEEDTESADEDAAGGEEGDAQQQKEEESEEEKEKKEDVQEGCTVFIRGLPFDAEPSDIKSAMRQFGRITLAIVVKDKLTGISKGSAFVKFSNTDEVAACLAEAALNSGLAIKDRVCKVNAAVDRESAQKLKVEDRQGKDKRNLYLANEGLVVPKDSDKTKKVGDMSEADKEKRQRAQNEKRKKLQNPLFFVSGNRVSVRNLGKDVTDHDLKVACLKAVKASLEKGLVTTEDLENHMKAQGTATSVTTDIPPFVTKTCVKSAKVMLDLTRVRGGVPQSRGYGFVEFLHHAHALGCLREMNNSSKYSDIATSSVNGVETTGGKGKLILEFSLENIQKVKILRDREVRQKQHNAPPSAAAPKDKKAKTAAVEADADSKSGNKQKDKKSNKQSESTAVVATPPSAYSSTKKNKRSAEQDGSVAADAQEPPKKKANKPDAVVAMESTPIAEAAPKPVAQKKESVAAKATEVGSVVVASGSGEAVSSSSAAEDAKKALKKENRKKRKLEDKLVRRETAFQAKKEAKQQQTAEGVSNGAPSSKKARVETSVTTATTEQPAKLHKLLRPKLDKKERAAAAEKKKKEAAAEETQKRPWGGHKRMRAEKLKKMGAAKKK